MGLKAKIAGKILGPRPGLAIVSFFGGRVEIALRILCVLLGSLPLLIAAAIALATLENSDADDVPRGFEDFEDLRDNTYAATGVAIGVACLGIIIEIAIIVLRFLNIGLINVKIKVFLLVDIVISFVLAGGHFVGGVLEVFYGDEWNEDKYSGVDEQEEISRAMIASGAFGFIGSVLFAILAVFMIIFLIKGWNSKVIKATVKEAVTG